LAKECVDRVRKNRASLLWQQRTSGNGLRTYASREALGNIVAQELQKVVKDLEEDQSKSPSAPATTSGANLSSAFSPQSHHPENIQPEFVNSNHLRLSSSEAAVESGRDETDAANDMLWDFDPLDVSDMSRDPSGNLSELEYEDLMLEMERTLHEEMEEEAQRHEMAIVMEYEKAEAALRDSIEAHERMMLEGSTPAVLCPLCQRGRLFQGNNSIFCINGDFRIDTQHDHINLQYLQNRLEEVCQDHSKSCAQVPGFVLQERFNIKALYLACQDCGTFQIVI
jgi:hypothetical protein